MLFNTLMRELGNVHYFVDQCHQYQIVQLSPSLSFSNPIEAAESPKQHLKSVMALMRASNLKLSPNKKKAIEAFFPPGESPRLAFAS